MASERADKSMILLRGTTLVPEEIVLPIVELILSQYLGKDAYQAQLPLHLKDGGDRWIVTGSAEAPLPKSQTEFTSGHVEIELMKSNAEIVRLYLQGRFKMPDDQRRAGSLKPR